MTEGAARPSSRRFVGGLLLILAAALAVRLFVVDRYMSRPLGDELYYYETASEIAAGNGHARDGVRHAWWPPANSFLLSLWIDPDEPPSERTVRPLLHLQALLGTVLVALVAWLGRLLFDDRTGLLAGLAAAFYPTLVVFSSYFWSETLFLTLLTGALAVGLRARGARTGGLHWATGAGLLFGLAGLTRELAILASIGFALWWIWSAGPAVGEDRDSNASVAPEGGLGGRETRRSAALHAALMLAVAAAVVVPWTWRNYRLLGRFVPVSTVSWMAIRQGNTFDETDWTRPPVDSVRTFVREYIVDPDENGRSDRARAEALELIRAEQPWWVLKKLVRNPAMLFNPDSFVFKKVSRGAYRDLSPATVRATLVATTLSYLLLFTVGVLGIAATRGRGRRALVLGLAAIVTALHVFALASPRYRLPLIPLLLVFASHALVGGAWRPARLARLGLRERWIVLFVLAWFYLWCVPYFRADAVSLWRQGTYVEPLRP